jgi:hypothetical protein
MPFQGGPVISGATSTSFFDPSVNPDSNIRLEADAASRVAIRLQQFSSGSNMVAGGLLAGERARGTAKAPEAVTTNNLLIGLEGRGWDGAAFAAQAGFSLQAAEGWTAAAKGTRATLTLTPTGSAVPADVLRFLADLIQPVSNNAIDLGDGTHRFKVLHVGGITMAGQSYSFGANDSGGAGFRQVLVPNA